MAIMSPEELAGANAGGWSVYYTLQTNVYKVVLPSYKLVYKP